MGLWRAAAALFGSAIPEKPGIAGDASFWEGGGPGVALFACAVLAEDVCHLRVPLANRQR